MSNLGYKKQSPEQQRVQGIDCCADVVFEEKEDKETRKVMEAMRVNETINYDIAERFYLYKETLVSIGKRLGLNKDIMQNRHNQIKDDVAKEVLY